MRPLIWSVALTLLVLGGGIRDSEAAAVYADWTLISGTNGSGTFSVASGLPNFAFTLTDDVTPSDTQIDADDVFDNNSWETLFGEGDNQESLRFRSPGEVSNVDAITVSTLTITFSGPVNPSGTWAFAVTDLEGEDAVINASLGGSPIADATMVNWFQDLFDSKPATSGSPHLPSGFDAGNVAVVAEFDPDGLLSNEILTPPSGIESPSAWFIPNTPIDTLTISHRNRFGGTASMHVYMAATEPVSEPSTIPEPSTFTLAILAVVAGHDRQAT